MVARLAMAVGGLGLFGSLFLRWAPVGIEGAYLNRSIGEPSYSGVFSVFGGGDAWQIFSSLDILLAVLAFGAVLAAVVPLRPLVVVTVLGAVVLGGIVLYHAFHQSGLFYAGVGPGVVLGFAFCLVIAIGAATSAILRLRDRWSSASPRPPSAAAGPRARR